jgi:hypothetical protein
MEDDRSTLPTPKRTPWNKGKLIGAKPPLLARHVWSISHLFDHLVGDCEKRRRNFQVERIGGPQI